MKIYFYGGAKTVTGSCYLVKAGGLNFLVDCGLFQGGKKLKMLNGEAFEFEPKKIDCLLLTHAHIDHSGRIPLLCKSGFKGGIITTKATKDLCEILLPDSGHIQEFETEWLNRKRERSGLPLVEPLYTMNDAKESLKQFKPVRYGQIIDLNDNVKVKFNDAGHILGSAIIEIWVKENNKTSKIVFSGDLGKENTPILRDPAVIKDADFLIVESTYGNRIHKDNENKVKRLVNVMARTIERGGNVIIPSFAVGRTQEMIYDINKQHVKNDSRLKKLLSTPVYIDSPLAIKATEIFEKNTDCYDKEAIDYIAMGDNPFDFPGLKFTRTADESRELNFKKESSIIISASGMCDAGRIKHHLKHNLWRKESTVLFVGYQAEGTLGRRIVDGEKKVKIFGETINIASDIEVIEGFSGHADKNGLLKWIKGFENKPLKIFIIHGEEDQMAEFSKSIGEETGIETIMPSRGESFELNTENVKDRTDELKKEKIDIRFRRLELIDSIEKINEELSEVSDMVVEELKKGKSDGEVEVLIARVKAIENQLVSMVDEL